MSLRQKILHDIENVTAQDTSISIEERQAFQNVLLLKSLHAEDIMLPRADLQAIECSLTYEKVQEKLFDIKIVIGLFGLASMY